MFKVYIKSKTLFLLSLPFAPLCASAEAIAQAPIALAHAVGGTGGTPFSKKHLCTSQ